MDAYEATRIVLSRIQTLDPDNAAKIMGLLLIQDYGEKEMIRLAFGPESLVQSVVLRARKELGLLLPPTNLSISLSSPNPFSRQNSTTSRLSSSGLPSPSSWASSSIFSRSNSTNTSLLSSPVDDLTNPDELTRSSGPASPFYCGGGELIDEFQLQDQLSFLNNQSGNQSFPNSSINDFCTKTTNTDLFYSDISTDCRSSSSNGVDSVLFPYMNCEAGSGGNGHHRTSCSMADLYLNSDVTGFGWKPCVYFARGYCKNGSSCRFQHILPSDATVAGAAAAISGSKMDAMMEREFHELLLRSKSQRLAGVASSQLMASAAAFPSVTSAPSLTSDKSMDFLLQQQQSETQRTMAAAAALMLGGDEQHKFFSRSRYDYAGLMNPGSRQIYLTFPADSTFREEDVSNYFSIYGPVQDVRIPYQQKRMFGFVSFVYPETVRLILAKGNPHFVCNARVLVKPYKEKGKLPDKKLQQQQFQSERFDFSACSTPTGLDSGDPYDLQQLGARLLYSSQEMLLRRKLEEHQQAAELQQAIELQGRRFMGLQLRDVKSRYPSSPSLPSPIGMPTTITTHPITTTNNNSREEVSLEENCFIPVPATATFKQNDKVTVNAAAPTDKEEPVGSDGNLTNDSDFQESAEHNLPDSPFASPVTTAFTGASFSVVSEAMGRASAAHTSSFLLDPSSMDMSSLQSCFFPMPRFSSSGHGEVEL